MANITFEMPTAERIQYVADHMRDADAREVMASHAMTPIQALTDAVNYSNFAVVICVDMVPHAVAGLKIINIMSNTGSPWLLATEDAPKYKREFLTMPLPVIDEMRQLCPVLVNYVHVKNRLSIRWLQRLGFDVDTNTEIPNPLTGEMFYRFKMERDNV